MRKSNYDKHPISRVSGDESVAVEGWDDIAARVLEDLETKPGRRKVLVVDCYPGVDETEIVRELGSRLHPQLVVSAPEALKSDDEIATLIASYTGGDDPLFGFICDKSLPEFFDAAKVQELQNAIGSVQEGLVLVAGRGAALIHRGDVLVYADLARWEIQQRFRKGLSGHYGAINEVASVAEKYKRAYFVDWRVADNWKAPLLKRCDFLLDTNSPEAPKLVDGPAFRAGLEAMTHRPFRLVPFFDPAPWGGQWMKEVCDLDREVTNFGWCFDCVPEENSLLVQFGRVTIEAPAMDLVLLKPEALLGDGVYRRFGAEFPIRFDFLDTMEGGNLSFQVHPTTAYIQSHFGMAYTQDESYYLLDAGPDASVYLGLKRDINPGAMEADLERAQRDGTAFPASKYANQWAAHKHDHFSIPAGTVHCSGANAMVLEISATPYIFTFKLWDWGRMGLDGRPRPINIRRGIENIQWDRTTEWVESNLIARPEVVAQGDDWVEERTGLHAAEFIETRRHWFTGPVEHDTGGNLNVLNLVEGEEVTIESPDGDFEAFAIHYAETLVIPARVGRYRICPSGPVRSSRYATLKAFVRPDTP